MQILVLGLALYIVPHLFKRVLPPVRSRMGERRGKMLVAVLSLAGVLLMVIGYRRAEVEPIYTPFGGAGHLTDLLMLIAIFLMGVPQSKGLVRAWIRHPMLTGVIVWAVAHLLVNGDLASILLFGALGLWAIVAMLLINAQESWTPPEPGNLRGDFVNLAISIVLYALIAGVHIWLGHNPFLGTYG